MNWWEWVFSGIGASAVVLLIQWWIKRSPSTEQQSTITAQGASVKDSPVASGSGIVQTIGDTHHHHYSQAAELQPPALGPEPAPRPQPEQPRPNIKIAGCRKIHFRTELDGAFCQSNDGRAQGEAVVVTVTNDAVREAINGGAIIKAAIIYQHAGQELLRAMGCWLNDASDVVQFRVDDSHSLVLGVVVNGQFSVPAKRRVIHGIGQVSFPTDPHYLACERATVTVRLTNADTGVLYCEEQFEVATNPLSITAPQ